MNKFLIACVILGTLCVSQVSAQTPTCKDGFYWDNQKCEACSASCKTCSAPGKCTTCLDGNYLNGDMCMSCKHDGVKTCCAVGNDSNAIRATDCNDGYYLDGSVCVKADENCMTRIGATMICQACKPGFYLDEHNVCTSGNITGCKTYTNVNNCSGCQDGYYLETTTNGAGFKIQSCTKCNDNCTCSDNKNLCVACVAGSYESQGKDQPKACTKCTAAANGLERTPLKCDANGCLSTDKSSCPSDSLCSGKAPTLTCQALENCLTVTTSTTAAQLICSACKVGYYIKDGACVKCVGSTDPSTDYAKCKSDVDIQQCPQTVWTVPFTNSKYLVPDPAATPANTKVCKDNINNCKTMKDAGQLCTACYDGYLNVDGVCKACTSLDANCIECAVTGTAGSQKLQCNKCRNNVDDVTKSNYFPKADKSGCQTYPDKVMSCATNSDTASELKTCTCMSGYKIQKGTESTCQACSDANCKTCGDKNVDNTTTCTVCNAGYGVVNNACEKCTENCMNCDSNSAICKTCKGGYFLVDKYCSVKRDHCTSYDSNGCSVCEYNFYKNSQHCTKCSDLTIKTTNGGTTYGAYERIPGAANCVKVDPKTCAPVSVTPPSPSGSSTASTSGSTTDSTTTTSSGSTTTPSTSTTGTTSANILAAGLALVFSLFIIF